MMKKVLLAVALLVATFLCIAQEEQPSVMADRPGMSTGPDVLPFLKVQWETGFEGGWGDVHSVLLPTTMFRFGVTKFAEIRLEYDGGLVQHRHPQKDWWGYDVSPLTLGTKVRIFDSYKWVPKISLMANLAIPLTRAQLHDTHVAPSLHLLFQNDVTDWFNIGYDVGTEWDGVTAIPSTFLGICLGFNATDDLGVFVESYNYFTKYAMHDTEAECDLDFGLSYVVHPKVQLDLYAGFNCQDPRTMSFVGLGVAWMIN